MEKVRRFKFLRTGLKSDYNDYQWEMGKWHATECVELCHGFNCSNRIIDALGYVKGEILAEVEVRGKHFHGHDKSTHTEMKIIRAWKWQKEDSVALSIFSAELVLKNFESKFPNDDRPRKAIEAAKNYLANPTTENQSAARAAAYVAARAAAYAADAAARAAARAARAAAYAAADAAARAARAAAYVAADAADAAYVAARAAAYVARAALNTIETWLLEHLLEMEEIK